MSEEIVKQPTELSPAEPTAELDHSIFPDETVHLIATNGQQMAAAQVQLTAWLQKKLQEESAAIVELEDLRDYAKSHKWNTAKFSGPLSKAKKRQLFYSKLLVAAEAGYTIIPAIPLDIFAIRVDAAVGDMASDTSTQKGLNREWLTRHESAEILPAGEGSYICPTPTHKSYTTHEDWGNQKNALVHNVYASQLKEVEFPVIAAVPRVMDATALAMSLKVFDAIGISPAQGVQARNRHTTTVPTPNAQKVDPLIIGIIGQQVRYSEIVKPVHFLIAWHLDLREL